MKLGSYEIFSCDTGRFRLDGGAMFGVVPKTLWQKEIPADDKNRIDLALRTLLIKGPNFNCLIDVGMGDKWQDKEKSIYELQMENLDQCLIKTAGIQAKDITHIIITHLHFDHCGGLSSWKDSNHQELSINFPNATIYIHEENFNWASNPNLREKASYLEFNWSAYKKSGQIQLIQSKLMEPKEILPNIWIYLSQGHTHGQQLPLLSVNNKNVFFCGDLFPSASHLRIPWNMGYDIQPLVIMKEKQIILDEAKKNQWLFHFEHDPSKGLCELMWPEEKHKIPTAKSII